MGQASLCGMQLAWLFQARLQRQRFAGIWFHQKGLVACISAPFAACMLPTVHAIPVVPMCFGTLALLNHQLPARCHITWLVKHVNVHPIEDVSAGGHMQYRCGASGTYLFGAMSYVTV